ncbi:uncharacterized protein LOC108909948 [Anoplophora glabripennis]|uniref:uncharacterized protein LOC108909948 n=1 Tax=Anoplophora glabripennis TaxID=217634 RepID=UPI000874EFA1|nr:uncharacterized protein LOC108909948 [Anoplophora glabripennis]
MNMASAKNYIKSIVVLVTFVSTARQECIRDAYTVPQGDIVLRYGEALNITCNLLKEGAGKDDLNASSRLFFMRDNKPVPPEMVKIINSTSINLYVGEHPKTTEANYYCYFNATEGSRMICMNSVYVGENLTVTTTSPHSIELSWTIPDSMIKFPPGLHHRVLYRSEYEEEWHLGGIIRGVKNRTLWFTLENLKYAHTLYDIRVSMRSSVADEDDESMWSGNATITVRTERAVSDGPSKF